MRGKIHNSLARELSGVRDACVDAFAAHGWITAYDLVRSDVCSQVVQNDRDRNTCPNQARLTVTDVWLDGDVFAPIHWRVILSREPQCRTERRRGAVCNRKANGSGGDWKTVIRAEGSDCM